MAYAIQARSPISPDFRPRVLLSARPRTSSVRYLGLSSRTRVGVPDVRRCTAAGREGRHAGLIRVYVGQAGGAVLSAAAALLHRKRLAVTRQPCPRERVSAPENPQSPRSSSRRFGYRFGPSEDGQAVGNLSVGWTLARLHGSTLWLWPSGGSAQSTFRRAGLALSPDRRFHLSGVRNTSPVATVTPAYWPQYLLTGRSLGSWNRLDGIDLLVEGNVMNERRGKPSAISSWNRPGIEVPSGREDADRSSNNRMLLPPLGSI